MNYISVVVPTYNTYPKYCLEHLHRQKYPDNKFEVIVVENPIKTDNVYNLCKRYGFTHLATELGSNRARNAGISRARGNVIALCDDDVLVEPDWLQNINYRFEQGGFGVVGGKVEVERFTAPKWIDGEFLKYLSYVNYGQNIKFHCGDGYHIVSANCAFLKEKWNQNPLDEDIGYHGNLIGNDEVEFFSNLALDGGYFYDDNISATHMVPVERFELTWFRRRFNGQGWADCDLIMRNSEKSVNDIYHDNIQYGNLWLDLNHINYMRNRFCDEDVTRQYIRNLTICKTDYLVGFQNCIQEMWRSSYA